ncbi:nitroimidazol reductase NimA-like FMN-containing flavoprotein (pyridoxamine 5'-phosphate oxidase superfamily) [Arthrobacter sp. AG1021]|uniref:pyridoxamine 5'-phosphate oxidase family protein n=1 Tax=Arthrobacter sp. AG1021 TaxID=2183908 RepID=UPI000EB1D5B1|nr:pyridoxamine 5'-phosphate oxidase family protein [Arthrobacter sp. AG1021]RKS21113.1 nitroimidazol reductase NimA-like FMN-containing flavoprotein (pyridoxamine 5'-phosphate oxidase superfamily) [Arthrobacter sp. AG1021]
MKYDHDNNHPVLVLNEEQSWELLAHTSHGRVATSVAGDVDIVPVNYGVHKGKLFLRTAPGNKLASMTINDKVAFEADGILADEAWSVVVHGSAEVLEHEADIQEARESGVSPWVPTQKDFWIRIHVHSISGRHFQLGEQPEVGQ